MGLVSEPVSICGVDVSAPQQFRGQRRSTLDEMLESLGSCFTHNEVFKALVLFLVNFSPKALNCGAHFILLLFCLRSPKIVKGLDVKLKP